MDCDEEFDIEHGGAYPQLVRPSRPPRAKPSFWTPAMKIEEFIREEQAAGRIPKYANVNGKRVRVN